ncbi:MAG: response regulator transcription factor [Spirochaetales bacterium]|nr:response regulator transcription factor [Spirochaetales bacterium]
MPIRVLIADDDPLIREGLEIILGRDEDFKVVASVNDGKQAVDACISGRVDVALIDIRMPVLNGVEAVKQITEGSRTKTIILTTFDEDELIYRAVKNGARGYLLKGKTAREIKDTVKLVYNGSTVFQDSVFDKIQSGSASPKIDTSQFSEREIEVIKLIAEGYSNREIAGHLFLSEGTIKNYISSILSRLKLKQRTQIAVYYLKRGKI